MEGWGIRSCVSIAVTAAEHTPEIADNLFIWPNCIDPEIYRDYSESKVIPVLLSGAQASRYPWRAKIAKVVAGHFPSLVRPHPGYYRDRSRSPLLLYGERYARTSWIGEICTMLRARGQGALADAVENGPRTRLGSVDLPLNDSNVATRRLNADAPIHKPRLRFPPLSGWRYSRDPVTYFRPRNRWRSLQRRWASILLRFRD
jgi:hypothetical protein